MRSDQLVLIDDASPELPGSEWERRARDLMLEYLICLRSANTRIAYRGDIQTWLKYCLTSQLSPFEAKRKHAEAWARSMETRKPPLAKSTRARRLSAISSWYRYLVDEGEAPANPLDRLVRPRVNPDITLTRSLTADELTALLAAADSDPSPLGIRERFTLRLMAFNGLRVMEVAALDVPHLARIDGEPALRVVGKGDKDDVIRLPDSTWAAAHDYLESRAALAGTDVVLAGHRGAPVPLVTKLDARSRVTRSSLIHGLQTVAAAAGLPFADELYPHALRHTMVTLAHEAQVPFKKVIQMARHSDPRTTLRYDQNRKKLRDHGAPVLASFIEGPAAPAEDG